METFDLQFRDPSVFEAFRGFGIVNESTHLIIIINILWNVPRQ